ncbi:recombinase family protein [Rhizobium leguminosarum]|uniref:recombinase family protein n=1 Tax=Rhizobium leguminosarum TaxID=384 RepID=UPI001FE0E3A3|nr:recombinase family protein [Rhizobium leguminosarum]
MLAARYIDTSSAGGKLIFHILAALAEFEKSLIRERTIAGIEPAKTRGKRPGRRPTLTEAQCVEIRTAVNAGTSVQDVAQPCPSQSRPQGDRAPAVVAATLALLEQAEKGLRL